MNKHTLFDQGVELAERFCAANSLKMPAIRLVKSGEWRVSACAYYRADVISICIEKCAHIGTTGMAWSYPGYAIDRTPYGVIQHELGHHVDYTMSRGKGAYGGDFSESMRSTSREVKLTNYCPNDWEWFAEIFRLFVTNPDLLKAIRPKTYWLIIEAGFMPVVTQPWRSVLAGAPARTVEMALRK